MRGSRTQDERTKCDRRTRRTQTDKNLFYNNDLRNRLAARRVVAFPCDDNGLSCPTVANDPIDINSENPSPSNEKRPKSILSRLIKDRHKRAAKALGYALTLADPKNWAAIAIIWEARLEPAERYELARSVMLAMRPEDNEALAADVLGGAGLPLPPFLDPLDDAQWWADLANPTERRAYCLAAFMAMPKRDQRDFLEFAKEAVE